MSNTFKNIKALAAYVNTGRSYPAQAIVGKDPQNAAMIAKLVKTLVPAYQTEQQTGLAADGRAREISKGISDRINDNDNIMQLFPDLERAAQILVASIIAPKNMTGGGLIYGMQLDFLNTTVTSAITDVVKTHCEGYYKIDKELPKIIRAIVFEAGSYPLIVLPENSLDAIINNHNVTPTKLATEAFQELFHFSQPSGAKQEPASITGVRSLGILGPYRAKTETEAASLVTESYAQFYREVTTPVVENFQSSDVLKWGVTDNYWLLKYPQVLSSIRSGRIRQKLGFQKVSVEHVAGYSSGDTTTRNGLKAALFRPAAGEVKPYTVLKAGRNTGRKAIGRPLVMKAPAEAVIPVHMPGDPEDPVGYFVLIDIEGNFISRNSLSESSQHISAGLTNTNSATTSYLLDKARRNITNAENRNLSFDQAVNLTASIVEDELLNRLEHGMLGHRVALGRNMEVYRIMLARQFQNQYTRLLFVPTEMLTYFAFKYHANGVGKSLLDDTKILTSFRAVILFARVMGILRNAISLTQVDVQFDGKSPDPIKDMEMIQHLVMQMRQDIFPMGLNNPSDLAEWIVKAGFMFTFKGHPSLPDTQIEMSNKDMGYRVPDTEIDDQLRKLNYLSLGLTPEKVDSAFSVEYATVATYNDLLFSRQVEQFQDLLTPLLSKHVQQLLLADSILEEEICGKLRDNLTEIREAIVKNELLPADDPLLKDDGQLIRWVYELIAEQFTIDLPRADATSLINQKQAYDDYSENLDRLLNDAWLGDGIIDETIAGELAGQLNNFKAAIKASMLRQYAAREGYFSELNEYLELAEDGELKFDVEGNMAAFTKTIMKLATTFYTSLQPDKLQVNQDLTESGVELSGGSTFSDAFTDDGSEGGAVDFADDAGDSAFGESETDDGATTPAEAEAPDETE